MRREGGKEGACFGRILKSLLVSLWLCGSCNGLDFFVSNLWLKEAPSPPKPFVLLFYEFLIINSVAVD